MASLGAQLLVVAAIGLGLFIQPQLDFAADAVYVSGITIEAPWKPMP